MAVFDYRAKNKDGVTVDGAVIAPTENVAYGILRDRDLTIISLSERKKSVFDKLKFFGRVKTKEIVIFFRQLSVMISASVPLVKALRTLVRQTKNVRLKTIISDIADEVDGGAKLSQVMKRYPKVFSNFFVQMIRSAETTGKLDEILLYLADQAEKDYDLMSKVKGAMIYPVFILSGLLIVGVVMIMFVLPQVLSILAEGGAEELPMTTRAIIWLSDFLRGYWWTLIIVIVSVVMSYRAVVRTESGRRRVDILKIKIPIFGEIYNKTYLTRLARSLSTLLSSGVPLTQSLDIVADVIGNTFYRDLTRETIKEVEAGNSVTTVYARDKNVPVMLSQMMSVGEQSGRLDKILLKLADFYSRELENLLRNLVTLIEPIIMVLMGIGVGFLVSAIILPIYNLSSAI